MPTVLITGANGFIGSMLCSRLASGNKVIGVYHRKKPVNPENVVWERADPPASPEHPDFYRQMRQREREYALKHHGNERLLVDMDRFYRSLL